LKIENGKLKISVHFPAYQIENGKLKVENFGAFSCGK